MAMTKGERQMDLMLKKICFKAGARKTRYLWDELFQALFDVELNLDH